MLLYYIRHGDPIYNPDSLTPLGHRQAEAVAHRLSRFGIDRLYASTSTRAIETATPTSEILKKPITTLDFTNESHAWHDFTVHYGEAGKMTWVFSDPAYRRILVSPEIASAGDNWYADPRFEPGDAERFRGGIERVNRELDAFLSTLGYEHDREKHLYRAVKPNDERVALFAHQGFGMIFLSSLLDIPYPYVCTRMDTSHTGMTVIDFRTDAEGYSIPQILTLANDSHLYAENLPTDYNHRIRI